MACVDVSVHGYLYYCPYCRELVEAYPVATNAGHQLWCRHCHATLAEGLLRNNDLTLQERVYRYSPAIECKVS